MNLKKLFQTINEKTLTQMEVAKKQGISVRWVKEKTRNGKLKVYKVKSTRLYDKNEIK
jgi:hypothetical protein